MVAGLEITFATFPIMVIANQDFLPIRSICPHFLQKILNMPVGIEYTFEQ
jgi:hypothetical protein